MEDNRLIIGILIGILIILGIQLIIKIVISYFGIHLERFSLERDPETRKNVATRIGTCPFCGQDAGYIYTDDDTQKCCVVCDGTKGGCGSSTGYFDNAYDAMTMWNTRDGELLHRWEPYSGGSEEDEDE